MSNILYSCNPGPLSAPIVAGGKPGMKTGNPACASCAYPKLLKPSVLAAQLDIGQLWAGSTLLSFLSPSFSCFSTCHPLLLRWTISGGGGWCFKPRLCEKLPRTMAPTTLYLSCTLLYPVSLWYLGVKTSQKSKYQ